MAITIGNGPDAARPGPDPDPGLRRDQAPREAGAASDPSCDGGEGGLPREPAGRGGAGLADLDERVRRCLQALESGGVDPRAVRQLRAMLTAGGRPPLKGWGAPGEDGEGGAGGPPGTEGRKAAPGRRGRGR